MKASEIGAPNRTIVTPQLYLHRVYFAKHVPKKRVFVLSKPPHQLAIMSNNHPSRILITWPEPQCPQSAMLKSGGAIGFLVTRIPNKIIYLMLDLMFSTPNGMTNRKSNTDQTVSHVATFATHRHLYKMYYIAYKI